MKEEMLKRLDAIAAKLNVTAEHLWAILVKQARVEALTDIFTVVGSLLVWFVAYKVVRWEFSRDDNDDDVSTGAVLVSLAASFIALVASLIALYSLPTELLNPEYLAFRRLTELIKQ